MVMASVMSYEENEIYKRYAPHPHNASYTYLTSWPTDIPADVKQITIYNEWIVDIADDAFEPFYQLELLSLSRTHITTMPNLIPVGNTLKSLSIMLCRLTELNATVLNELRVLKSISLRNCYWLTSIPDVPGPGNTFTTFGLQGCDLDAFPILSSYPHLSTWNLNHNSRISGPLLEAHLAGTPDLGMLMLTNTAITSLPNAPRYMHKIGRLEVPPAVSIQLFLRNIGYFKFNVV